MHKRRLNHGCGKVPSFGVDGRSGRKFCAEHKRVGMAHSIKEYSRLKVK